MTNQLSILLPAFNTNCSQLVEELSRQAADISLQSGFRYEIIVAEDGSTNQETIAANKAILDLENCRHIVQEKNIGRAAIRNLLTREAQYKWLLFIDSDMSVGKDFIRNYLATDAAQVIDGGYILHRDDRRWKGNLRYLYEVKGEETHSCEQRTRHPYQQFHTSNFLVQREVLIKHPFDEQIKEYGYEDVLWGRTLKENNITISHIDNPVLFVDFEDNLAYLQKTETALHTLYKYKDQLEGFSQLLTTANRLKKNRLDGIIRTLYRITQKPIRKNLISAHPSLLLFKLHKLGYFLSIEEEAR